MRFSVAEDIGFGPFLGCEAQSMLVPLSYVVLVGGDVLGEPEDEDSGEGKGVEARLPDWAGQWPLPQEWQGSYRSAAASPAMELV